MSNKEHFLKQPPVFSKPEKSTETQVSVYDRVRNALKIPKAIDDALETAERAGDFKAVDAFNNDVEQAPKLPPRDSGNRLKKLLLTSTIGLVSATHTPQIEQAGKRAMIVAEDTVDEIKVRANLLKEALENKFENILDKKFTGEFGGGNAKMGEGNRVEIGGGKYIDISKTMREGLKNFEALNGKLTEEQQKQYFKIFEARRSAPDYYQKVLSQLEIIHGNATEADVRNAERASNRLIEEIKGVLSKEELKDPVRIAFEVSKHRTMYAREKASLTELLNSNEGNCDALTRLLIATVPQIVEHGFNMEMSAQIFQDHVRFLVRKNTNDKWHWIDGQTHGTLTAEDVKGTLIVEVDDFIKQAIGLKKPTGISVNKQQELEKGFGYKTNSKLRWTTDDNRSPKKRFTENEIPLRIDESKNKNISFTQAERKKEEPEIQRIIEVSGDFSHTPQTPEEERKTPKFFVSDEDVIKATRTGDLFGDFDDISNMSGVVARVASIYRPAHSDMSVIDVSALRDSKLEKLELIGFSKITGIEQVDTTDIKTLNISFSNINVIEKILDTAKKLDEIVISVDETISPKERKLFLMNIDEKLKQPIFEKLSKKMKEGKVLLVISYPYESEIQNKLLKLNHDGSWRVATEESGPDRKDYLTENVRNALARNKQNPKELGIPHTVTNSDYLWEEGVDLSKVETLIVNHIFEKEEDGEENEYGEKVRRSFLPEFGLKKILAEAHPHTIEFFITRDDGDVDNIDLSFLKNTSVKNIIFHVEKNAFRPVSFFGHHNLNIVYDMSEKVAQAE